MRKIYIATGSIDDVIASLQDAKAKGCTRVYQSVDIDNCGYGVKATTDLWAIEDSVDKSVLS